MTIPQYVTFPQFRCLHDSKSQMLTYLYIRIAYAWIIEHSLTFMIGNRGIILALEYSYSSSVYIWERIALSLPNNSLRLQIGSWEMQFYQQRTNCLVKILQLNCHLQHFYLQTPAFHDFNRHLCLQLVMLD